MADERTLLRLTAASLLLASGCGDPLPPNQPGALASASASGPATSSAPGAKASVKPLDLGTFVYPGSAELTWGHVTANVGEITWRARVSDDPPEKVIAWFAERLGPGQPTDNGEVVWRDDADAPKDVGSVMPVGSPGPHHDGTKIPDGARTVILTSTMTRY